MWLKIQKQKRQNMKEQKFENKKELNLLNINRLFTLQKIQLELAAHYIQNNSMYDKNDIYNTLQEVIAINMVITKKLKESKTS